MRVDDTKRLLDNGAMIVLFRNQLGSYTAAALRGHEYESVEMFIGDLDEGPNITDDFEPSKALYRLAEKQLGNIADTSSGNDGE